MGDALIANVRALEPGKGIIAAWVQVREGKIAALGPSSNEPDDSVERIDGGGRLLTPGLIDVHAHLREPGFEYKETIKTGTLAAVKGGFTSLVCMANTNPVNDNRSVTEAIVEKARAEGACRVFPCGSITKGLKGEELSEIGDMYAAGIVAVSDDGKSVRNADLLRKALEYVKLFNIPVISHCEDEDLSKGYVNEGAASVLSGLDAVPMVTPQRTQRK